VIKQINGSAIASALGQLFKGLRISLGVLDVINVSVDMLELMKQDVNYKVAMNLSGSGEVVFKTVPVGERWYLDSLAIGTTSGNKVAVQVYIGGIEYGITLSGTAAIEVDLTGFTLNEGDSLRVNGTSDGGDNARWVFSHYKKVMLNN